MYKMAMLLGLLVAIMNVSALGAGFMGTPTAELEQGQWSAGFNYMYSDMELDKTKLKPVMSFDIEISNAWLEGLLGGPIPNVEDSVAGDIFKIEIDDVKTQRYYGTIGYGLTDLWEVYVQLGIADLKSKTRDADEPDVWSGINFDNDFAWGWGTRYTFYEQDNVRWGASVQMNWLDTSWDEKAVYEGEEDVDIPGIGRIRGSGEVMEESQIDWETYDLLIAVGPTVDMGGWNLYGGPFYYMIRGDLDIKETATFDVEADLPAPVGAVTASGALTMDASGDLEADSFGGFVGMQCTLMENSSLTTEISFTGDGWGIGAGVCYAF